MEPESNSKDVVFHGLYALATGLTADLLYRELKKEKIKFLKFLTSTKKGNS